MLSKTLETQINQAISREFTSKYLYLSMAAHFAAENLTGFSHFFDIHQQEEEMHAMKMFHFVIERGSRVLLGGQEAPKGSFSSVEEVLSTALEHERTQTKFLNSLMDLCIKESDHACRGFLQWFIDEQVEEEALFESVLAKIRLNAGNGYGLLMLDGELAKRTLTAPPANS